MEQEIFDVIKADELFLVYVLFKSSSSLLNSENIHLHVLLFSLSNGTWYLTFALWHLVLTKLCRIMEVFPLLQTLGLLLFLMNPLAMIVTQQLIFLLMVQRWKNDLINWSCALPCDYYTCVHLEYRFEWSCILLI